MPLGNSATEVSLTSNVTNSLSFPTAFGSWDMAVFLRLRYLSRGSLQMSLRSLSLNHPHPSRSKTLKSVKRENLIGTGFSVMSRIVSERVWTMFLLEKVFFSLAPPGWMQSRRTLSWPSVVLY